MLELPVLPLVLAFSYAGFACLALGQSRHWRQVAYLGELPRTRCRALRATAGLLLMAALVLAVLSEGAGFGCLLWATALSTGALGVAMTLAWRPQCLKPLTQLAAISAGSRSAVTGVCRQGGARDDPPVVEHREPP